MNIEFEHLTSKHQIAVMEIFNYYIATGTAAFPNSSLPEQAYPLLMKKSEGYPAYAIIDTDTYGIVGFCFLSPYNPLPTFKATAAVTYFISKDYTGRGLGGTCLKKCEEDAADMGITNLIAEISSENVRSIAFHKKHGFQIVGELKGIGAKLKCSFGVVYMQKSI